jgi:hypothetical protein
VLRIERDAQGGLTECEVGVDLKMDLWFGVPLVWKMSRFERIVGQGRDEMRLEVCQYLTR